MGDWKPRMNRAVRHLAGQLAGIRPGTLSPGFIETFRVSINGVEQALKPERGGYLAISREWKSGDSVLYTMDMPIRAMYANPAVRQLVGRVSIQRGPVVYCLEGVDHGGIVLDRISFDPADITGKFTLEQRPDLLGGVAVIHGKGKVISESETSALYFTGSRPLPEEEIDITAVPYCVWDNREPGEMRVWLRT